MAVVRLDLAYDGTRFRGWAKQRRGIRTVEGVIGEALATMLGAEPKLSVAGRTDAGVHASGQVASFRSGEDPLRIQRGLNGMLAPEVSVVRARRVGDGFDARRSARARIYVYRIWTAEWQDPFRARYVWHLPGLGELGAMRRAARELVGEHDFRSFGRARPGETTIRRLDRIAIGRSGELVTFRVRGRAFLRQMVRSLVGTLVDVAKGRIDPEAMASILEARSRGAAGHVAPPDGLTLEQVLYGG